MCGGAFCIIHVIFILKRIYSFYLRTIPEKNDIAFCIINS